MRQLAHYNSQPHPTPRVYHPGRRGCHREPPHKLLDSCYRVLVVTAPHLNQATHVQQLGKRRQQLEGTLRYLAQHTGPRVNHAVPHLNGNVQAVMTHILPVHHRPAVHLRLQAGEQLLHKDLMRTLRSHWDHAHAPRSEMPCWACAPNRAPSLAQGVE